MNPLLLLLVIPLITALVTAFLVKQRTLVWGIFLVVSGTLSYLLFAMYGKWDLSWSVELGFDLFDTHLVLSLANQPLGWFFAFFASVTTMLIALFSLAFNDRSHDSKTAPVWLLLLFASSGIFFAKDWILFFAMWEAMSISSYFVVAHGKEIPAKAAKFYLSVSLIGTSTMLFGILSVAKLSGTFAIEDSIQGLIGLFGTHYGTALLYMGLFTVTFFIKSAVFPFYMWPAKAYAEAPDDFTPFLSSVMSKYGIYGMMLFILPILQQASLPGMGNINQPAYLLAWLGAITSVIGTMLAIFETDIKRLFAYSSVANIGYIVMGLASLSLTGIQGALFHSVNHMVIKAAIFLSLAAVIYRTGERDMHRMGGLVYRMPLTFLVYLLGIISAAGIPPMNGFASKWLIIQSLMSQQMLAIAIAMIVASTGAFLYLFRVLASVFLGQLPAKYNTIQEAPLLMAVPMTILMVLMLAIGVLPGIVMKPVNGILSGMGYAVDPSTWSTLHTELLLSDLNVTHIFYVFMGGLVISLLFYFFSGKSHRVAQEDNYTGGEYPADWGTTPERFNFSYGFYQPFEEMFRPVMDRISLDRWMSAFGKILDRVSNGFRVLYTRSEGALLMLSLGIAILIIGGWLL